MALIKCPECKKQVSDSAEACPHCGYKLKEHEPNYVGLSVEKSIRHHFIKEMVAAVILAIVGVFCIVCGAINDIVSCWITGIVIFVVSIIGFIYNYLRHKRY